MTSIISRNSGTLTVVAIANYHGDSHGKLSLKLGDVVNVIEELEHWYCGVLVRNRAVRGIFPKNHVSVISSDPSSRSSTEGNVVDPMIKEITSTLREWLIHWKNHYVQPSSQFGQVRKLMLQLLSLRSQLVLSNLASEDIRGIQQKVVNCIDYGNKILELDLVVRDNSGKHLDVDSTSVIQVYRQHEKAVERISNLDKKQGPGHIHSSSDSQSKSSYTLFVAIRNFVCKIGEDAELVIGVYDATNLVPITESYVVSWDKKGLATDLDMLGNMKAFFTDFCMSDIRKANLLLVCNIVRLGTMDAKDPSNQRSSSKKSSVENQMRRPFGVAMYDITDIVHGNAAWDEDKHCFVPFTPCNERESLDACLRRLMNTRDNKDHKGQGLWCSFGLLQGNINEVSEEHPSLVLGNYSVSRKIGFPETILPGDTRNDLYITLVSGDFGRNMGSERSIEVVVRVYDENGKVMENVLFVGCDKESKSQFRSVVYYHDDKPKWNEILKIVLPTEEFYNSHLRFTFRHRSSSEGKDKHERPFAISYARLIQKDGTTLKDGQHELMVYRIDLKNYKEADVSYLSLPSTRVEATDCVSKQISTLSHSAKDSFIMQSCLCSTKLTQNAELLGLLRWRDPETDISQVLMDFLVIDKNEVVRFLQDALDSLFAILMEISHSDQYDSLVFQCLIFLIGLVSQHKYKQFIPVLDLYIKDNFSATLAYGKLLNMMKVYSEKISENESVDCLLPTMKSLPYLFKFVARSRLLYAALNDPQKDDDFEDMLENLFESFIKLTSYQEVHLITSQCALLRFLPKCLEDVLDVFDPAKLSDLIVRLMESVPASRLGTEKFKTFNELAEGPLFRIASARSVLLPVLLENVQLYLKRGSEKEELATCSQIMANIMDVLHRKDIGSTEKDMVTVIHFMLPTVQKALIWMDAREQRGLMVAILISIFREMSQHQYYSYVSAFNGREALLDFLAQIMCQFKDLVSVQMYNKDWVVMTLLANSVILKAIRLFSHTIRDHFSNPFVEQVWNNFFQCAIAFMTQEALQLENFSAAKRKKIIVRYKDMRREMGFEIRAMWFNLGLNKSHFIPSMVGPFLEMTLIPETELRKATIPIFFDMMQHEFYLSSDTHRPDSSLSVTSEVTSVGIKRNFQMVENQMIQQLDTLIEGGRGDSHYKDLFYIILTSLCEDHKSLKTSGVVFVHMATKLIERLLEYRTMVTDEHRDNRMSCTVNILDFYREINKQEMYLRYLYKLHALHIDCDNFGEAAHTLQLHAQLLSWNDESLTDSLAGSRRSGCRTHRDLKESLYQEMIELFVKGHMWEWALKTCKELAFQYEEEVFDYEKLSSVLTRMAEFYHNIRTELRPEPEYFRVAFFGRGFPAFLQNRVYVYRGMEYEKLGDFSARIQMQFPNSELMQKLTAPSKDVMESPRQYLQINKVDPIMEANRRFSGKPISEPILKYYRSNDVSKFTFSRPFHRGEKDKENEFATLWLERTVLTTSYPLPGILRWFPVTQTEVYELSPLETAVESMESANNQLKELILANRSNPLLNYNPLSMKLQGMIDAAVNGGTAKYEKVFLTDDYLKEFPEERHLVTRLEDLLCTQTSLLEAGIEVHAMRVTDQVRPFHDHLETKFAELKESRDAKYGQRVLDSITEKQLGVLVRPGTRSINVDAISDCRTSSSSAHSGETISGVVSMGGKSLVTASCMNLTSTPKSDKVATRQSSTASLFSMITTPGFGTKRREKDKTKKKERKESIFGTLEKKSKKRDSMKRLSIEPFSSMLSTSSSFTSSLSISTLTENSVGNSRDSRDFTPSTPPIIELNQELTASRPQRPESATRERKNSNGLRRLSIGSQSSGSLATPVQRSIESLNSIDDAPPPLPAKASTALSMDLSAGVPPIIGTPRARVKLLPPLPCDDSDSSVADSQTPPTPPPKKPPLRMNFSP